MSPAAVRVRLAVPPVPTQSLVVLSMVMKPVSVPRAPVAFKVRVPVVAEPVTISVPVPVMVPVAVKLKDDAVMLLVPMLMFPSFAVVLEALRMREPVVVLSDRADAIAMSPAVWLREKMPAKVAGRAVRAPAVAVAR